MFDNPIPIYSSNNVTERVNIHWPHSGLVYLVSSSIPFYNPGCFTYPNLTACRHKNDSKTSQDRNILNNDGFSVTV